MFILNEYLLQGQGLVFDLHFVTSWVIFGQVFVTNCKAIGSNPQLHWWETSDSMTHMLTSKGPSSFVTLLNHQQIFVESNFEKIKKNILHSLTVI